MSDLSAFRRSRIYAQGWNAAREPRIHGTVRKDVVGSPQPGDLLGQVTGKAYLVTGGASREPLDTAVGGSYLVVGGAFCAPATTTVVDDADPRIAYSTGWHQPSAIATISGTPWLPARW